MTKAHPREKDVRHEIRRRLEARSKLMHWHSPASVHSKPGVSDILGVAAPHGTFFAIEAKLDREMGTAAQEDFMGDVRAKGGRTFLCNRRTLDDGSFDAFLDSLTQLTYAE